MFSKDTLAKVEQILQSDCGVTHGIVLIVIILFLAPLASDIPLAALAAILFDCGIRVFDEYRNKKCGFIARYRPALSCQILSQH